MNYKSDLDIKRQFDLDHPQLIGAVCALLSAGLANLEAVKVQRPYTHRLADFEQMGEAIHQAIGQPPGWFGNLMANRRQADASVMAEADSLMTGVLLVVNQWISDPKLLGPKPSGRTLISNKSAVWHSNGRVYVAATLAHILPEVRKKMPFETYREQPLPNERAFRNGITHRMPTLEALGWTVQFQQVVDRWSVVFSREIAP